jgi:hypothetical protein
MQQVKLTVDTVPIKPNLFKNFDENHPDLEILEPKTVVTDRKDDDFRATHDDPQYIVAEIPEKSSNYGKHLDEMIGPAEMLETLSKEFTVADLIKQGNLVGAEYWLGRKLTLEEISQSYKPAPDKMPKANHEPAPRAPEPEPESKSDSEFMAEKRKYIADVLASMRETPAHPMPPPLISEPPTPAASEPPTPPPLISESPAVSSSSSSSSSSLLPDYAQGDRDQFFADLKSQIFRATNINILRSDFKKKFAFLSGAEEGYSKGKKMRLRASLLALVDAQEAKEKAERAAVRQFNTPPSSPHSSSAVPEPPGGGPAPMHVQPRASSITAEILKEHTPLRHVQTRTATPHSASSLPPLPSLDPNLTAAFEKRHKALKADSDDDEFGSGLGLKIRKSVRHKYAHLGNEIYIHMPRLNEQNTLTLKNGRIKSGAIGDYKTHMVSDNLKRIINAVVKGAEYDADDLDDNEKTLLNYLLKKAERGKVPGVEKKKSIKTDQPILGTPVQRMETQLALCMGEIMNGNDSPELKLQLATLAKRLLQRDMIPQERYEKIREKFIM